jgi:hypothetical protein
LRAVICANSGHIRDCASKELKKMKQLKLMVILACLSSLLGGAALAADKPAKKLTCCEQAAADNKECKHKCCIAAHKDGNSCVKCNPNKEDLKLKKKKADQKANQ